MKTAKIIAITATILMSLSALVTFAQTSGPPPASSGAPIDGGATALVIGAAVMGYKKMKERKKEKEKEKSE